VPTFSYLLIITAIKVTDTKAILLQVHEKCVNLLLRSLFRCTSKTPNEVYNANCTRVKYQPNGLKPSTVNMSSCQASTITIHLGNLTQQESQESSVQFLDWVKITVNVNMMTCFFEASDSGESCTTKHVYLCVYVCMINIKAVE